MKKIEDIMKEALFEIAQGRNDPFHSVLSDALDNINAPDESICKHLEKEKSEPE